jgi:hypothetical protein
MKTISKAVADDAENSQGGGVAFATFRCIP